MLDSVKIAINTMPININNNPSFFNELPPLAVISKLLISHSFIDLYSK